jgi:serine/threonine-protein kinase
MELEAKSMAADHNPPMIGRQLSHYKIIEKIGSGGMGEVFRARDIRLGRDVAVKISIDQFSERFEREARLVAALNHTNICTLHDVGPNYLVMELVDGPTLADRIQQGAIPLQESLQIARQIAAALDAAHEKGIIHRDLKPGNIKLTRDGVVKVLDFGLAKLWAPSTAGSSDESPTFADAETEPGVVMGTVGYMAPEQTRGKTVDKRADIWAFGAVLYEMLAGRRAFEAATGPDTIAAVLQQEPDWSRVPRQLRHLLQRCLEKDPRRRLRDIGDVQWELENAGQATDEQAAAAAAGRPSMRLTRMWFLGAMLFAALTGLIVWLAKPSPSLQMRRFELSGIDTQHFALSPDGSRAAYVSNSHLYVRALDALQPRDLAPLPPASSPLSAGIPGFGIFWSPDSQTIAFASEGTLRRIPAGGGTAIVICKIPATGRILGAVWRTDGSIVFSVWRDSLYTVPAAGGTAELYLKIDAEKEIDFHNVSALPDNRLVLATHVRATDGQSQRAEIFDGRQRIALTQEPGVFQIAYVPPGYLMFIRRGDNRGLWALPLRKAPLDFSKAAMVEPDAVSFQAANDGTLLVVTPPAAARRELVWVDRNGAVSPVPGAAPSLYLLGGLSPDGHRSVFVSAEGPTPPGELPLGDIFVRDLSSGLDTRLTFDRSRKEFVAWSPSGDRLIYSISKVEATKIYAMRADGTGSSRELTVGERGKLSPDGKYLIFLSDDRGMSHLRYAPILPDGTLGPSQPVFHTDDEPIVLRFEISPDGNLLAYGGPTTNSQTADLFLTQFPNGNGRWQVTSSGVSPGTPHFSHDGRELFYSTGSRFMSVPITSKPSPKVGPASALFDINATERLSAAGFDVSSDGRFLMSRLTSPADTGAQRLTLVQNWLAAPKK